MKNKYKFKTLEDPQDWSYSEGFLYNVKETLKLVFIVPPALIVSLLFFGAWALWVMFDMHVLGTKYRKSFYNK